MSLPAVGNRLRAVDLAMAAAAFGDALHRAGIPVTPERSGRFAEALHVVLPATLDELYWSARVTLLSGPEQRESFDATFAYLFRGFSDVADYRGAQPPPLPWALPSSERRGAATPDRPPGADAERRSGGVVLPGADPTESDRAPEPAGAEGVLAAASADERLRAQDFAACTPDELARLAHLLTALSVGLTRRPARRWRTHHSGRRVDLRATMRRARRSGGQPVRLVRDRRLSRPRRLVLLADVSGSMAPYARPYLYLLHGAVRAARAEAFVFSTRLTRLTRALQASHPEQALRAAVGSAPDWAGGTRIGEAVRAFLDEWGRRGLARGATVVIVSDGWEGAAGGDLLGEQMARLARLAHRIVWVNPRRQSPRYQPLAAGMAAALPHVDAFVSGHSLEAMGEVIAAIRA